MIEQNVFREARMMAMSCVLQAKANKLVEAAVACRAVFDRFNVSASRADFKELVGLWTIMLLAMDDCGPWIGKPPHDPRRLALSNQAAAADVAAVLEKNVDHPVRDAN